MASRKYRLRRWGAALLFFLVIVGGTLGYSAFLKSPLKKNIVFEQKEFVQDLIRFVVKPIYAVNEKKIICHVFLESFQNQSGLSTDLLNTTYIRDDQQNIYLPVSWKQVSQSDTTLKGVLTFSVDFDSFSVLKLYFFAREDVIFEWKRQGNSK